MGLLGVPPLFPCRGLVLAEGGPAAGAANMAWVRTGLAESTFG